MFIYKKHVHYSKKVIDEVFARYFGQSNNSDYVRTWKYTYFCVGPTYSECNEFGEPGRVYRMLNGSQECELVLEYFDSPVDVLSYFWKRGEQNG